MVELLTRFEPGELIGLVAVVGGLLCGIVAIIAGSWFKMREITLKEEMVNRGMSAEEIRLVLDGGSKSGCGRSEESKSCRS
ncbi:MAG TPA: hypothetical protein VGP68_00305 [Gemmataceae bacterium]|nr:hypothetical protein [Gemmataceae bacterium]